MTEEKLEHPHIVEQLADDGSGVGMEVATATEVLDEDDITSPFDPKKIDINSRAYSIEQLISRIAHNEITMTPDFQRQASIWKRKQMSRLIESILLKIPLPTFYLATDEEDHWLVVDGLQRISAIKEYVTDQEWALTGLEFLAEFEGCFFKDLTRPMQRRINETELFMHIIQPGTPKDVTRTIFRRINTGGLPLSAQEIRHALYQGESTKFLSRLVNSSSYLNATTHSVSDDRMTGREACLRMIAFLLAAPELYQKKNMDEFLCKTMENINLMNAEKIENLQEIFCLSMKRNEQIFGDNAFRKKFEHEATSRYPINKALFEIWGVALANIEEEDFKVLLKRKDILIYTNIQMLNGRFSPEGQLIYTDFERAVSQDTSDPKVVLRRFRAVNELIDNVLTGNDLQC